MTNSLNKLKHHSNFLDNWFALCYQSFVSIETECQIGKLAFYHLIISATDFLEALFYKNVKFTKYTTYTQPESERNHLFVCHINLDRSEFFCTLGEYNSGWDSSE